jgi:hypothetical protein
MSPEQLSRPGAYIDETTNKDNKPVLSYSAYDENGKLVFYREFPLNYSPADIANYFNMRAIECLKVPINDPDASAYYELARAFLNESERVPGLGDET